MRSTAVVNRPVPFMLSEKYTISWSSVKWKPDVRVPARARKTDQNIRKKMNGTAFFISNES